MANTFDSEEAKLRENLMAQPASAPSPDPAMDDEAVRAIVSRASTQTGARDLVVLAVSSFFALLLIVFAPLAKSTLSAKSDLPDTKEPPEHR